MHRRHIAPLSVGELLTLSAPARDRLLSARSEDDGVPLSAELRSSRLANGVGSTAFARLCRPAGPTSRAAVSQPALMRSVIARGLIGEVHTRVADTVAERFAMSTERQDTATLLLGAVQAAQSLNRRTRAATTLTSLNVVRVAAAANGHADASAAIGGQLDTLDLDSHQLLAANAPLLPTTLAEALPAASASTVIDAMFHAVAGLDAGAGAHRRSRVPGRASAFGRRVDPVALRSRLVEALAPEPFAARRAAARAIVPASSAARRASSR